MTKYEERAKTWQRVKEDKWQYMMFLPAAILLILFSHMPMVGLIGAIKDYRIRFTLADSLWCNIPFKKVMMTFVQIRMLFNGGQITYCCSCVIGGCTTHSGYL
ncbi:MAG: hypothetical protein IJZ74_04945 [Clostridia bacterium]|nr:hypothetical protein [Clostridia bacterium]